MSFELVGAPQNQQQNANEFIKKIAFVVENWMTQKDNDPVAAALQNYNGVPTLEGFVAKSLLLTEVSMQPQWCSSLDIENRSRYAKICNGWGILHSEHVRPEFDRTMIEISFSEIWNTTFLSAEFSTLTQEDDSKRFKSMVNQMYHRLEKYCKEFRYYHERDLKTLKALVISYALIVRLRFFAYLLYWDDGADATRASHAYEISSASKMLSDVTSQLVDISQELANAGVRNTADFILFLESDDSEFLNLRDDVHAILPSPEEDIHAKVREKLMNAQNAQNARNDFGPGLFSSRSSVV
jgi:hypothetical protein